MDSDLKCNRLTCHKALLDKAVVTTCSHIFCIDCANELFNSARLCPACETNLTEPDDVVVCSLQPTNDYKTSVLSGLSPSIILEICSRAISFWQYQIHQENTFQHAVVRNLNDKNAQLQKQLDNVVREANGEINLLNIKREELERDLELERRKVRELQDGSRERDKEYAKLKAHFDKLKRKALFGGSNNEHVTGAGVSSAIPNQYEDLRMRSGKNHLGNQGSNGNLNAIIGGMEANGVQRTPLSARTNGGGAFGMTNPANHSRNVPHRLPFPNYGNAQDRSFMSTSDRSASATNEVEAMLLGPPATRNSIQHGWQIPHQPQSSRPVTRIFGNTDNNPRSSRGFRPAVGR